jgi:hypothetical protein
MHTILLFPFLNHFQIFMKLGGTHHSAPGFNYLQLVTTTWPLHEPVGWKDHYCHFLWDPEMLYGNKSLKNV